MKILPLVLILAVSAVRSAEVAWTYRDQGLWDNQCLVGRAQSPIDIQTQLTEERNFGKFRFTNYIVKPPVQTLANDGHSVKVDFKSPVTFLSRGGLPSHYMFLQYHFHWGDSDDTGSEHTIDGARSPLELHLVHWNTRYGSVERAVAQPDGLAVLGILYEVSPVDNEALEKIVRHLPDVAQAETKVDYSDLPALSDLLPTDRSRFYRYFGSLTTPACNEAVVWTVFEDKQKVSPRQLAAFRQLRDSSGGLNSYNFRSEQPVLDRRVFRSGPPEFSSRLSFQPVRMRKYTRESGLHLLYAYLCGADRRYCVPDAPF